MNFLSSLFICTFACFSFCCEIGSGFVLIDQSNRTIGVDPSGICDEFNGHYGIHHGSNTEEQHRNNGFQTFSFIKCNICRQKVRCVPTIDYFWGKILGGDDSARKMKIIFCYFPKPAGVSNNAISNRLKNPSNKNLVLKP